VESILGEDKWNYIFAMKDDLYTYEGFLRAVAKFPAFCNESNWSNVTPNEACRYELATLFAHFGQETGNHNPNDPDIEEWRQGLVHITEWACTEPQPGAGTSSCDYKQNWGVGASYPPQPDVQYYGRGPFQLSWNYNYGAFSEVISPDSGYRSFMYLLDDPDMVHTDAFTVFASALWFYMTPQSPKPSIHDVATGYMEPTSADIAVGIAGGFGTTTNIINGGHECGLGSETD
jgi:chitodextrinase